MSALARQAEIRATDMLDRFGPAKCEALNLEQAQRLCLQLVTRRRENFTVLSRLVPVVRRNDFAALYAWCRWADDLADHAPSPEQALSWLGWWRDETRLACEGSTRHPVLTALAPVIAARHLPFDCFDQLIRGFELDQSRKRWPTWDALLGSCRLTACPVGRLVLMILGQERTEQIFARSDEICIALQLTNHWQDIARDIVERDRIYLPQEMVKIEDFERRLAASARLGHGVDRAFLGETRALVKEAVERTWPFFERGEGLLGLLQPGARRIVWLLAQGGARTLELIERWNYESVLHRPSLGRVTRLLLVLRAMGVS